MILVTGANGFIGRHAVRNFLAAGIPVRALLHAPDPEFAAEFPQAECVSGDLADETALTRVVRGAACIVHLASKNVDHDASGFSAINVEGTRNLCRAAIGAGVGRMLYMSSVGVYGHRRIVDGRESEPLAPDTDFSRSKVAAERVVLDFHAEGSMEAVVLRHRFVYGQGDAHVLPRMIRAARKFPIWLDGGRARMSLIHAPDLAEILRRFAVLDAIPEPDPVYHATDGAPVSFRQLVETLCQAFDIQGPRFSVPYGLVYWPVRLREWIARIDPEVTASSLSSIRLQLVGQDNFFSNQRLRERLPELVLEDFRHAFPRCRDYYAQFAG